MANRYPYPHSQVRPGMAPPIPTGFPSVSMWHHQPQSQSLTNSHHLQLTEEKRQREYLKQQQKLRLMAATTNKQPVNADKLIENLLETKETFRPRNSQQTAPSLIPNAQVPVRHTVSTQNSYMVTGGIRPINYSQSYPHHSSHHSSASTSGAVEVSSRSQKKSVQENSGIGFQLPTWLSSQSPSLPSLYRHVWTLVGLDKGLVDTSKIFPLLLTSGLPTDVLGYIWGLANQKIAGQLTEDELYIVLALVGLAQSGCTFSNLSILNLIPQAPVPSLNLSSLQLPTHRNDRPVSSHGILSVEEKMSNVSGLRESGMPLNMSHQIEETSDDFSDFQSASCSNDPAPVLVPDPDPDPDPEGASEPALSHDSPIHIKDAVSTPSVAFQGVSPATDGHKFQSIFSLGNSSSRGVGSRLANHSLGAPKQTKNRHHKHHHHHHHHHHHRSVQQTASAATQISEQVGKNPITTSSPEEDDFSDFQQAKDPVPVCNSNTNDLFPKCPVKTHNKQYMLKESAIRSDNTESKLFFESPVHIKLKSISSEISTTTDSHTALEASDSDSKILPKPDLSSVSLQTSDHELLSVEEDKYSALRALAEQEAPDAREIVSDDFGDFLSAEPASTEDSFAALASRDVPKSGERILESKSFWPSSGETSQTVEFQLDDWSTFESNPEIISGNSNINSNLLSTGTAESSVSGLVSTLQGLDLQTSGSDFSWDIGNQARSTEVEKDSGRLEVNTASPVPSATTSDNWLEMNDDFSQSQSTYKGCGLTFLGKIYDDHNQLISNTKNDLFVLENEQHADNGPFVIKTQDDDDEFGEFIGPEAWPDDSKFAVKEAVFEGQAVLRIKDAMCDTQSVSSLELPVLSRHGSLPSLDLKIFPGGSDKSGLLHSWDCSPQGIDLQIKEWCRCLQSCLQLLQAGLAIFTTISNESIVEEVVTAHEGKEYLLNLLEVYGICRRLKQSSSGITSDSKLDSILAEVDIVWTSMESYFTKAELKIAEMDFGCSVLDPTPEHSACGICLTSVGSEIVQDNPNNVYPLEYGGQVYHAACANLWVNCVDCRLPGLASTGSLL